MTINLNRRRLLQACGLGVAAPFLQPQTLSAIGLAADASPVPLQPVLPPSPVAPRLFRLNPSRHYQLHDDLHASCLAFGPRSQRVVDLLVDAPVFGDTGPVAAQALEAEGFDGWDWLALIIDAADPQALADANAVAVRLERQDIYLRFALVLEDDTPPESAALVTLNQALDGVVLFGPAADGPVQRTAPEATAMALLEHFLIPCGLIGIDISDVRYMLRQGLGMHRAVGANCLSATEVAFSSPFGLVETLNALATDEPLEQAQVAMVWLAGWMDVQIEEFDAVSNALVDLMMLDANTMVGMGVSPQMAEGQRNLVLLYG
ncbi:hypothetical protein [Lamprobacter modestohalophilus]|nr:hypothetical protein [Lamprobacter modestohalophilus]